MHKYGKIASLLRIFLKMKKIKRKKCISVIFFENNMYNCIYSNNSDSKSVPSQTVKPSSTVPNHPQPSPTTPTVPNGF